MWPQGSSLCHIQAIKSQRFLLTPFSAEAPTARNDSAFSQGHLKGLALVVVW